MSRIVAHLNDVAAGLGELFPAARRVVLAGLLLAVGRSAHGQEALLRGRVVAGVGARAVAGAEVLINGGMAKTLSDSAGRFAFVVHPGRTHVVTVRSLGFEPMTSEVEFSPGVELEFELRALVPYLDRVVVSDSAADPLARSKLAGFYARRGQGFGRFVTRGDFERTGARRTSNILALRIPGVKIVPSPCGLGAFLATVRPAIGLTARAPGAVCGRRMSGSICFVRVLLDGAAVYSGHAGDPPFDVNSIAPDQIAGLEFYAGAAQLPAEFNSTGSSCGVVAIWTR